MKNHIIILDGPKGAGKTTIGTLLENKISDAVFLNFDSIRRAIPGASATPEYNQMAFDKLLQQIEEHITHDKNVIVDCGLTKTRLPIIEKLAADLDVHMYKFFLIGPAEILLERVKKRDLEKGKTTNEERFHYLYDLLQSKDMSDYVAFDTHEFYPEKIVDEIMSLTDNDK